MKGDHMKRKTNTPEVYTARKTSKVVTALGICAMIAVSSVSGFAGGYLWSRMNEDGQANNKTSQVRNVKTVVSNDLSEVVDTCSKSVVEITTESVASGNHAFGQYVQQGAGSGVILTEDGYIVTNDHVVSGASSITVKTSDGKEYNAQLVGTDSVSDIAVLKVDGQGLEAAVVGSSADLEVGETAIAIGNPLGSLGGTVTTGIISALDREIEVNGETMTLLQTDAAVNPGNSGGGLFNTAGALIGIVNAKTSSEGIEGLGFAIPVDEALSVAQELMENGTVKNRAALNVSLYDTDQGVMIVQVLQGGAAEQAGLQVNDVILSVDGRKVSSVSDVKKIIRSHAPGDELVLNVVRGENVQAVSLKLGTAS